MNPNEQYPLQYPSRESMFEYKTFKFTANTIDGNILEFPYTFWMRCDLVTPLYQDIVRAYDKNECIVARKVYLVSYGGHLYGTLDFTNMDDFVQYQRSNCASISSGLCDVFFEGCEVVYNECRVVVNCSLCNN